MPSQGHPRSQAAAQGKVLVCQVSRAGWRGSVTRPDKLIWGPDWPHLTDGQRDTGEVLNLLADWAPDADDRRAILVDGPERLFFSLARQVRTPGDHCSRLGQPAPARGGRRQEPRASMYGMSASMKPREADGGASAKASWKDS
jgi:hypothetical protein